MSPVRINGTRDCLLNLTCLGSFESMVEGLRLDMALQRE